MCFVLHQTPLINDNQFSNRKLVNFSNHFFLTPNVTACVVFTAISPNSMKIKFSNPETLQLFKPLSFLYLNSLCILLLLCLTCLPCVLCYYYIWPVCLVILGCLIGKRKSESVQNTGTDAQVRVQGGCWMLDHCYWRQGIVLLKHLRKT